VYRVSIVDGLADNASGACDDIRDYSKKDPLTGEYGVRVRYSVMSAPFQYNGTLAHGFTATTTVAPLSTAAPDETTAATTPATGALDLEPVGAIDDLWVCTAGHDCANDVGKGDRAWIGGPKKRFHLQLPVPTSGSSSALLYRLEAEKLTEQAVGAATPCVRETTSAPHVEATTSIRFPYQAMKHNSGDAKYLDLCVGADRTACGPADSAIRHPVFADASFLEVSRQYRFRIRAERQLRSGDVEAGPWSLWTHTTDGSGLLVGPPAREMYQEPVHSVNMEDRTFAHANAVVLEFQNHFRLADDILGKSLEERRADAGWTAEPVVDALRYEVYRVDLGPDGSAHSLPIGATWKTVSPEYLLKSLPLKAVLQNEKLYVQDEASGQPVLNPAYNGNPYGTTSD
jgi:hypothetical protein